MSGSTRIAGRQLSLRVGDGQADYWADATVVELRPDHPELDEALGGGYVTLSARWHLYLEAVQSTDESSMWAFLWEHAGRHVPFAYAPHANEVPTPDQPHFTGICYVPTPPRIGGRAGEDVEYIFEILMPIVQGPLRVTTPNGEGS